MEYTIRKMEERDVNPVQEVAKKSWNTTYEKIIPLEIQERFLDTAYNDEMMIKRLNGSYLYVAEKDQQIVGFANFSTVKEEGEVELGAIYLYPEYQGKGIGTALLHEGIKNLKGVKSIYINVEKENSIGTNFYQAKGFEVISEFDDNLEGHITKMFRMVLSV
ncbi:GNAT family N-acetyltransferase [Guptibacillus hwajinpoensis]|uniref:Ribosomal protein S18 acetylase RimI-like enzyme n=1 Tax=Guptibacillus hwajinpoensis TaxID=208199 RepID=A0ABU0K0J5_9BACL|nr:GNAT family N-acetyltransferase [Alkalihalobacillus hemicentroti]MDQ0481839.1 ribosomal protein S18 acetylase RimI-like enzyme [Alkalihalobacillus hemicentroti]